MNARDLMVTRDPTHSRSEGLANFRWLERKDGTVALQQMFIVKEVNFLGQEIAFRHEWRDVPTVIEQ